MKSQKCKYCDSAEIIDVINLGTAPASNNFLKLEDFYKSEPHFPLKVKHCLECRYFFLDFFAPHDSLFNSDYVYFSSISQTWLRHCDVFADKMNDHVKDRPSKFVMEIASNDGALLYEFKRRGHKTLGIEPTLSTAMECRKKGVEVITQFFGYELSKKIKLDFGYPSLIAANNVIAHVPDIRDFAKGIAELLTDDAMGSLEFPHVLNLIKFRQLDTIYHEHYSYISLGFLKRLFGDLNVVIHDVEELPTHGGSLRVYISKTGHEVTSNVDRILAQENELWKNIEGEIHGFELEAHSMRKVALDFLITEKLKGSKVVAYGAAAKGNTLLNYYGIRSDLIEYVVDRAPSKIGRFLPGSRIPVVEEMMLKETRPDYVWILPWNIKAELIEQLSYIRDWNGKFVVTSPRFEIF